jgi:hypothetical protein
MTPAVSVPVAPLSIWHPIHLGTDETGRRVEINLAERNMLIGGEPGGGKSVALQLIVAHGALSADCKLILIDGKRSSSACGGSARRSSWARRWMTRSASWAGCRISLMSALTCCCR